MKLVVQNALLVFGKELCSRKEGLLIKPECYFIFNYFIKGKSLFCSRPLQVAQDLT